MKLIILISFFPFVMMWFLGKLIFNNLFRLNVSDFMATLGAYLILFVIAFLVYKNQDPLDLSLLSSDKSLLYSKIYYGNSKKHTYCKEFNHLIRSEFYDDVNEPYIIFVCRPVNNYSKITQRRVSYYKYHRLDANGEIKLCGWRDNEIKYDNKGNIKDLITNKNNSTPCRNFNINKYRDI
ncbi:hypothetical protein [Vibrio metschnikovii]|uniref:hypothetical protein n=1 Tax=Vibrio metschnikovii TaxID=28172 RepID=UPI001C2F5D7B|nr:hypothetical protein [Vibrio metschnikovii]